MTIGMPTNRGQSRLTKRNEKRKYIQTQIRKCILLGYVEDTKYYKLMETSTRISFIARSVQFNKYPLQYLQPVEEEGRSDMPTPFTHDENDVSSDDSYS